MHTPEMSIELPSQVRDFLRQQEIRRELDEMAAFRASLDEKINGKREETLAAAQGGEKITVGKLSDFSVS